MARPSRDQACMEVAKVFALRGTCSRAQVGVVIARDGRVLVTGYNGAPAGLPHCDHTCDCLPDEVWHGNEPVREVHEPNCKSEQPCLIAVHGEANAIAYAARHGIQVEGATLYTTLTPCLACAMLIINAGIKKVFAAQPYRDTSGHDLLQRAGVDIISA